ncbi:hypothetical protein C0995_005546 [Termitomyces sp. Mi166|nr:hypothetical protein C0995_005546 [Termitomyces sp. Mi166\
MSTNHIPTPAPTTPTTRTPTILSAFLHRLRNLLIRTLLRALRLFSPSLDRFLTRLSSSPGLPVSTPTEAYWQLPRAPIAEWGKDEDIPEYADVVVLGSGITGTAVVRTLLDWCRDNNHDERKEVRVVMLEAREACSGATGRNGGHITPVLYDQYPELKDAFGAETAAQIIRFRLGHLEALLEAAREEGLLEDSQCRRVDTFDVFLSKEQFGESKRKLEMYLKELPEVSKEYRIREGEEVIKELQLKENMAGCISTRAGAVHPYRLVTGILSRLLREYSSTFRLFTRTPCTSISVSIRDEVELYEVTTPRGTIRAQHVVHATNGWVSHLLPGMRGKIVPARGTMTTQTVKNESWAGGRSFVFFPEVGTNAFDYLTQLPVGGGGRYPSSEGEMMLGGAFANGNVIEEMGNADDGGWDQKAGRYLSGALDRYFAWSEKEKEEERVKKLWSGVLGISVDGQPWVGRVPEVVAGRGAPRRVGLGAEKTEGSDGREMGRGDLAGPGEWMACGYSGEGMVHAWLSGKALAYMVLGLDKEETEKVDADGRRGAGDELGRWFPWVYRVSEKRWAGAGIEDLIAWFV